MPQKVPATMADVLKAHIAKCPQHPMSDVLKVARLALEHLQHTLSNPPLELTLARVISDATGEPNPYREEPQ